MNVRDPADPDWHPWVRPVKTGVAVAAAIPTVWLVAETGSPWALLVAAPTALYAAVMRDVGFVVIVGAGLLLLTVLSFWAAFLGDEPSGLPLLGIPFLGIPFVLVAWFVQALALPPES